MIDVTGVGRAVRPGVTSDPVLAASRADDVLRVIQCCVVDRAPIANARLLT